MDKSYDVIVAGLGAMGSAAAYHLARRGLRVLGFDRFQPPHQLGSSHGLTRIIREAYFEHPSYVPLVQRAYELWADLEKESGRRLLLQTGGFMIGPPDGALVSGARRSAEKHHLRHEILSAAELRRRAPIFEPDENMIAVWEPRAGILFPEIAVQTHLDLAAKHGASLKFNEPVLQWAANGDGIRVSTSAGAYTAARLMLAAGTWMDSLVSQRQGGDHGNKHTTQSSRSPGFPQLNLPLSVERQVLFWFEARSQADQFQPVRCPVHIWEYAAERFFYGFPDLGDGIKAAVHHEGQPANPEDIRREAGENEIQVMRSILRRFIPAAEGRLKSSSVCLYTNTPDQHFVFDFHPMHPGVLIASPCSGHGFKFSSVIGELAAMLLTGQQPSSDLSLFKIDRFINS